MFLLHMGRRNIFSPRSPRREKKSPCEASTRSPKSCVVFFSPRSPKILLAKRREAHGRQIGIGRAELDLQFLPCVLPLLLSPSADTA
ncbi:hypothetical protein BHE74_00021917 [Ensete ventricosum]|nr:hypothetical protein BHE74_00021917 [Ensete ventricosum]